MKIEEIIERVKTLNLEPNTYIILGSCPMAIYNLREVSDIDIMVTKKIYDKLKNVGWEYKYKDINDGPLSNGVFEVLTGFRFGTYRPTLSQLLEKAVTIDEVVFSSLGEVRKWKSLLGRPKDMADIKLIDDYLNNQN